MLLDLTGKAGAVYLILEAIVEYTLLPRRFQWNQWVVRQGAAEYDNEITEEDAEKDDEDGKELDDEHVEEINGEDD